MVIIEKYMTEYEAGISSYDVLRIFKDYGIKLSEATLRKYIQLGLLPRSHRVGTGEKGRNRGSRGLYPSSILKSINDIKRMLVEGMTLDDIARAALKYRRDISTINRDLDKLISNMTTEVMSPHFDVSLKPVIEKDLNKARDNARQLIETLENIDSTITNPKPTL